jgi:hypothetical protein
MITTNAYLLGGTILALVLSLSVHSASAGQGTGKVVKVKSPVVVVECYYRAKWGYADEFFRLYKKNHLPVMRKLQEEGRILKIEIAKPRYHATEDGRWDYRVALTFRDAAAAHDPGYEDAIRRKLYPDQDVLQKEESRRFEILASHWDVVVDPVDPDAK